MNDEIKEILDYFQKDVDKYEESKRYLMQKYGYDEETIDNISQHERHINTKKLLDYITNLQQENERLKAKYDNNKSHEINYKYFTTLYSKATKDIVIDDLVYKCEDLDNLRQSYEKLYIEKEDYKSRCEKAKDKLRRDYYTNYTQHNDDVVREAINILQNGSDDE